MKVVIVGLLATWLVPGSLLAQAAPADAWGIVAAYGAAAPFALLCLWIIRRLLTEIDTLRKENAEVTALGMAQVVPALIRSTETVADAAKSLEGANVMMHTLAGRTVPAETYERFTRVLRAVERKFDEAP